MELLKQLFSSFIHNHETIHIYKTRVSVEVLLALNKKFLTFNFCKHYTLDFHSVRAAVHCRRVQKLQINCNDEIVLYSFLWYLNISRRYKEHTLVRSGIKRLSFPWLTSAPSIETYRKWRKILNRLFPSTLFHYFYFCYCM